MHGGTERLRNRKGFGIHPHYIMIPRNVNGVRIGIGGCGSSDIRNENLLCWKTDKARQRLSGGPLRLSRPTGTLHRSTPCEMSQPLPCLFSQLPPCMICKPLSCIFSQPSLLYEVQASALFVFAVFPSARSPSLHSGTSNRCPRDLARKTCSHSCGAVEEQGELSWPNMLIHQDTSLFGLYLTLEL